MGGILSNSPRIAPSHSSERIGRSARSLGSYSINLGSNSHEFNNKWGDNERSAKLPEGKHKVTFHNGDVYVGMWKNGLMHGRGTLAIKADKTLYEGEFKNSQYHGEGVLLYGNGNVFKGHFVCGCRDGEGHLDFPNGTSVKGVWERDISVVLPDTHGPEHISTDVEVTDNLDCCDKKILTVQNSVSSFDSHSFDA